MGRDEAALLRLWKEKRGELEPLDLSGDLIVQLGVVTEPLNRHWYELNTGYAITCGIRAKAATDSDGKRPPNPSESGHRFRSKAATLWIG